MANENHEQNHLKAVLEMYRHAEERRGLQISRIWKTMTFTTGIILGIITATITLLEYLPSLIVLFLPGFAILIAGWAILNNRRQYHRFLEIITWISKVEKYLGLYEQIDEVERIQFVEEPNLIPKRWLESGAFRTGEGFITSKLTICSNTMYRYFTALYFLYLVLAGILLHFTIFQVMP